MPEYQDTDGPMPPAPSPGTAASQVWPGVTTAASSEMPATASSVAAPVPSHPTQRPQRKGIAGVLVAIGAAIAKWWAVVLSVLLKFKAVLVALKLLTFGKLLLTGGSMLVSMFLWSYVYGWPMAVGIVLSIFIHECGHALAAWKLGHKLGIMVFIPFMGAFVTARAGKNVTEDAFVGIMGPIAGTLTAVACVGLFAATQSPFWLVLAMLGFFINLINLTPGRPLDGGWIAPLFSPKLLLPGNHPGSHRVSLQHDGLVHGHHEPARHDPGLASRQRQPLL